MKKRIILVILIHALLNILHAVEAEKWQLVKTIGDDRDDYTVFGLADAEIIDNKDIYILNAKANYVAHYDWEGNFKRRIGQRGQGPGDFSFPDSLAYLGNQLYILDKGNRRVVGLNLETDKYSFYKLEANDVISGKFSVANSNEFLGVFYFVRAKRGRFALLDKDFKVIRTFFNHYPVDVGVSDEKMTDPESTELIVRMVAVSSYTHPVFYLDRDKKEVLSTHNCPDNPIVFYLYNLEGKELTSFSYTIGEKKYGFPKFFLEATMEEIANTKKYPDMFTPNIDSVAVHQNHFVAFLSLEDYEQNEMVRYRTFCLIFDRTGKLKDKFPLKNNVRVFTYSNGYFLGTIRDADVEKLYIYKLNIK